tara:strand:+ start:211 stop:408 length:198 start_codon:yes stop_codon:yes gene_type:complete
MQEEKIFGTYIIKVIQLQTMTTEEFERMDAALTEAVENAIDCIPAELPARLVEKVQVVMGDSWDV